MHFLDKIDPEYIKKNIALGILANEDSLFNPLVRIPPEWEDTPELYLIQLMRSPEYFYFFIKYVLGLDMLPMHMSIMKDMWHRKFPMLICSRGWGKTFTMGLYSILRMCMLPERKVLIAGAGFRQSKLVFEYVEKIWDNSPILRSAYDINIDGPKHATDVWEFRMGGSILKAIPVGDGSKIRGLRAQDLFIDEFAAINELIYEQVLVGFAAVSSDPLNNVKDAAFEKFLKKHKDLFKLMKQGVPIDLASDKQTEDNQIVITGTADYHFNHFYRYFCNYRNIIRYADDRKKLQELLGGEEIPENLKPERYGIYRISIDLVPEGFMDAESLARSKATVAKDVYNMEYNAVFVKDSDGFFRRSLIDACTMKSNTKGLPTDEKFKTVLIGDPKQRYVLGIDVASERDNLAIVILELRENHRRIVNVWTTNRKKHAERLDKGLEKESNFFAYVAAKINELAAKFPAVEIGMDAGGGGIALMEALKDESLLLDGQSKILEKIDYSKPKPSDGIAGNHILEMVQFVNAQWTQEANHGMKKDFEDKKLLFPYYDTLELELSFQEDQRKRKKFNLPSEFEFFDSLEDAVTEVEKLKEELSLIVHTKTAAGRERWDTPDEKVGNKSIASMKKDRYSALLIANSLARKIQMNDVYQPLATSVGGLMFDNYKSEGDRYYSGSPLADRLNELYKNI